MSKPIRTAAEMREATLVSIEGRIGLLADPHSAVAAALRKAARQVRALPIAPAPDREALVDVVAHLVEIGDREGNSWSSTARTVLAAPQAAGVMK